LSFGNNSWSISSDRLAKIIGGFASVSSGVPGYVLLFVFGVLLAAQNVVVSLQCYILCSVIASQPGHICWDRSKTMEKM